eukprot:CAMPEP_0170197130 /NCGR_PEP_ID=MMETSP0040_2-20121228/65623_1 /TAXON_ID=641309 /ORGANISM="Lotharella oceanica, Strain CCMP622" /LENGTH=80 /DNA_ID=CAMNT_0010446743 /DNA_START=61 /DNA_END=303 /DNA_ORIENTATION=+
MHAGGTARARNFLRCASQRASAQSMRCCLHVSCTARAKALLYPLDRITTAARAWAWASGTPRQAGDDLMDASRWAAQPWR